MKKLFKKLLLILALPTFFLIACDKQTQDVEPQSKSTSVSLNGARVPEIGEVVFKGELTQKELSDISKDSITQEQLDIFALIPDEGKLSGYRTADGSFKYQIIERVDLSNSETQRVYCQGKASYGLVKCAVKAIDAYGCVQVTKKGDEYIVGSCQP